MALTYDSYGDDAGGIYRLGGRPYASIAAHPQREEQSRWSVVVYAGANAQQLPREQFFDTVLECHEHIQTNYALRRLRGQPT